MEARGPQKRPLLDIIKNNKNLLLSEGIAFTLLGIFALLTPIIFSLTLAYFMGWVLVVGAIILGIRTIRSTEIHNRAVSILSTILYLFLGFMFLFYPISGMETLTLILGFYFIFDGILKIYGSLQIKEVSAWRWVMLSGIISLILAVLIITTWPTNTPWVLGVVLGINLLATGLATLGFLWRLSRT